MDEIHAELRKADTTKEKLADLLPNQQDLLLRWKRLVTANTVEGQLKEFLQLQNSKEKCDEMLQKTKMKSIKIGKLFATQRITKHW